MNPDLQADIAVYYDGSCPMCSKEINYYQRLDARQRVQWINVAGTNPSCPIGYDQQTLLARFHVLDLKTSRVFDGAAGFARLWRAMPQPWRTIGAIASITPVRWVLEIGYRVTLKARPWITGVFFKRT